MDSTVGVLLDDLPASVRGRVAADSLARPASFWVERAVRQVRLANLKLVYRHYFYPPALNKQALPLPPESQWDIAINSPARRGTVDGHDVVFVDFTLRSTILTDSDSPAVSEPALGSVGGRWNESFVFPVDPTLILQRTGYACMDEDQFPPESVDAENAYQFYDDTCQVERAGNQLCHLTTLPSESCVNAVRRAIGRVHTDIRYDRVAFDPAVADRVRSGPLTTPDAPDLSVMTTGFQSLSNNRVVYRYIQPNHCALLERCVGGSGWRRLLMFDSYDHNQGGRPLHIGPVDYYVSGLGSA